LKFAEKNTTISNPGEVLQELRDISSMAMEYFEERIAPRLKVKMIEAQTACTSKSRSFLTSTIPLLTFFFKK
jgi:hypothetical protein